ncbi:MAG: ABC transporter ATP-binding protein [Bacteroidota bacterium]
MNNAIDIVDLGHTFSGGGRTLKVLEKISLKIYKNEFVSIIGPSGSGKTTILNLIAGYFSPSEGKILIDGTTVVKPGADRAYSFQEDSVFPWLTVKQNIEYGLKISGVPKLERRKISLSYLEKVGLSGFENYFPKDLSGGMKKRVDLARAYAISPQIHLMDEPFGALDAKTRFEMQNLLQTLWTYERKTVLFVTHDILEALFVSTRILVLSKAPARVLLDIKVPFDFPRVRNLKREDHFLALEEKIEQFLFNDE